MELPRMLIATHKALVLWDRGDQIVLRSGDGVYYGITWSHNELFVVSRGHEPARVRRFDSTFFPLDDPPFEHMGPPDDGPHQAFWWAGRLYVANTQYNRIEIWDQNSGEIGYVGWGGPPGKDVDHVNSIWRDLATGWFWIVEHRLQARPKRIRVLDTEMKLVETIELDLDCLADGPTHCGLHNIYREGDSFYTLGPSQIIEYHIDSGRVAEHTIEGVEPYKHYLRGFARTIGGYSFVGVSRASPGEGRGWGISKIAVLDRDLKKIEEVELSPEFGQVMEIRLLDCEDLAHNGIDCPLGDA